MIEQIFTNRNRGALPPTWDTGPDAYARSREKALLFRCTELAIESAFSYGIDLRVGATVASGDLIVGRYFAIDRRMGYNSTHAEYMAITDWIKTAMASGAPKPDTLVVSLEPCETCQDFIATVPSIKRVGFGLPRSAASDRGLVRAHDETVFQRALRLGLPYEVVAIDDPSLQIVGGIILDNTARDPDTQRVNVDNLGLQRALTIFNASQ